MRLNILGRVVAEKAEELVRRLDIMPMRQAYDLSIRANLETGGEVHGRDLRKNNGTSHSNLRQRRKATSKHMSKLQKRSETNYRRAREENPNRNGRFHTNIAHLK